LPVTISAAPGGPVGHSDGYAPLDIDSPADVHADAYLYAVADVDAATVLNADRSPCNHYIHP
jgi:hypothetical protein